MSEVTAVPLHPIAKGSLTKLWLGVATVLLVAVGAAYVGTEKQVVQAMTPEDFLASNARHSGVVQTPSGLQYQIIKQGRGPRPTASDMVLVQYEGRLLSGKVFDTTKTDGNPRPLSIVGTIPGWAEGLQLMNQGSTYRFWMPPNLAYGPNGTSDGIIPPNSVITFEVELLAVAPAQGMGGMPPGHGGM